MPAIRSSSRYSLRPAPVATRRALLNPIRLTRPPLSRNYSNDNLNSSVSASPTFTSNSSSLSSNSLYRPSVPGNDSTLHRSDSRPATPPASPSPSLYSVMSTSSTIRYIDRTQPNTPTTLTTHGSRRQGLQRTYAMILSPDPDSDQLIHHVSSIHSDSDSEDSGSDHKSDCMELTPRANPVKTGVSNLWDDLMETDEGECNAEPGYGKMRHMRPFRLTDIVFDTFNPDELPESEESILTRLDCMINAGLSHAEFKSVFTQCKKCKGLIARRNVHFHCCATVMAMQEFTPLDRASLLHCTGTEGLKPKSFEALMSFCDDCNKIMTHRTSLFHDCVFLKKYCEEV